MIRAGENQAVPRQQEDFSAIVTSGIADLVLNGVHLIGRRQYACVAVSAAEEAKVWYGSTLIDDVDPREMLEVRTGQQPATKSIQRLDLSTLLHDRAVELVRLIMHKAREAGLDRMPPAGMVITGGTANLQGLVELAQEYASCPVRRGYPPHSLKLPPELEDSSFATVVGLLLWGIQNRHPQHFTNNVVLSVSVAQRLKNWLSRFRPSRPRVVEA